MRALLAALSLCVLWAGSLPAIAQSDQWDGMRSASAARTLSGYARAIERRPQASRACLTAATRGLLNEVEARFGNVRVISTCRPGATIAGSGGRPSFHRYGMAVDFVAPSGRKREVVAFLGRRSLVMTYARMPHVHFNLGQGTRIVHGGGGRKGKRVRHARAR
jgi:uncharacterized protein YcbK (DUF882 family)